MVKKITLRQTNILLLVCACIAICPNAFADEGNTLWQIGKADNDTAEFALGRSSSGQYSSKFPSGALFIVGHSDPKKDFPYCQPGPADAWAGNKSHTISIVFALKAIPKFGNCELLFDFVDTHSSLPPKLEIKINDRTFIRPTPKGGGDASAQGQVEKGRQYILSLPFTVDALKPGNNIVTIRTLEGSWLLYDYLKLSAPDSVESAPLEKVTRIVDIFTSPYLIERDSQLYQPVMATVLHIGDPVDASLTVNGAESKKHSLSSGTRTIEGLAPAVSKQTKVDVAVKVEDKTLTEKKLTLDPVRKWTIYMLHHTHLDIGYTHVQTEVEQMQWRFLDQAIQLGEKTKDYPEESRFKWLPEGLWAVDSYLRNATPEKEKQFIDAVKKGCISLDALYGNELTALPRPEELLELTGFARRLAKKHDLTIDSAMITDVPGYTWGLIPTLAQSGVKYLSIGPNFGHRIGYTLSTWGDKPFYWQSPSGKDKVLCWMAGMGYSWFHTGLNYTKIDSKLESQRIFDYLNRLEQKDFPYDIVQIRYNIGSDNGPPDPMLPDIVKAWNEKYAYPKMIIASSSQMFRDFEKRYAKQIPTVRGDFTPYWEDGAASSSRETTINRAAAERITQAQTLFAMLAPDDYPDAAFNDAYREAVLYDEHTWGSWNSISDPEGDFTKGQWKIKQAFALNAEKESNRLLAQSVNTIATHDKKVSAVQVFNTCSWVRSDLVILPKDMSVAGDQVKRNGSSIPSQRLSTGQLAFVAACIPPFASTSFTFHDEEPIKTSIRTTASGNTLTSKMMKVTIDEKTGAITTVDYNGIDKNLVDTSKGMGLNDYFYVQGRDPKSPKTNGSVKITVKESGPIVASLLVESTAPGCEKLTREIRLNAGTLEIIDTLDKKNIYEQEAVHIAFPFNVPNGTMRMDIPWAVVRPETDQLEGACKNYFTIQRWVDVSNNDFGLTWASPDAPLIEIGSITNDPRSSVGWIKKLEPSTTLYSYVMNNYWETNYKASQPGLHTFRYAIRPHKKYDQADAAKFGIAQSQPLIVIPCKLSTPATESLLMIETEGIIATALKPSDDGEATILRLFNTSDKIQNAKVKLNQKGDIWLSNLTEETVSKLGSAVKMTPYEIVTLKITSP